MLPTVLGTLSVPLRYTAKEPSQHTSIATKKRYTPTTTTVSLMPV